MENALAANELEGSDIIEQQPGAPARPDMTARAIQQEFESAVQYDYNNRQRNQDNWRNYGGLEFGQYGPAQLAQLLAEGRIPDTYNITRQKVDSLAGAILKNPFDMDFLAVEPGEAELTQAVKQAALSDKELMDWEVSYTDLVIAGLIYEGVEEMYIDQRNHPLGNIAWRTALPGQVVFDPNWKTSSGKDCQKAWKISYLTAEKILQLWPKLDPLVRQYVLQNRALGSDFDPLSKGVTPNFDVLQESGINEKFRVIQFYEMVREKVWEEYDAMTGMVLPATDDVAFKKAWLDARNPKWEPDKILQRQVEKLVQYCTVIIPQIAPDVIIERKATAIQVGRLQFFPWSAARINGVPSGIIDLIKDIQRNINHREMLISYIIQTSAQGGEVMDPMLFGNDQTQIDDYIATRNQPNRTFISAPGAIGRNLMPQKLRKAEFPNDIQAQLVRMWDYADRISKSPAAYDARTEASGESGYLFAQKVRQAEQQQYVLFAGLKRHLNEKGEAYLEQAKRQYSVGGWQRDFLVPSDGNKTISLNEKVEVNGQTYIKADISQLPRHKVVVSESPSGLTNRLISRAVAAEVMATIPPENIGTRTVLTGTIVNSIDTFSADDKERLKKFRKLEEEQALETLKFGIQNLKLQQLNVEMQIKTLEQQKNQPQAPIGMGAPSAAPAPQMPPLGANAAMQAQGAGQPAQGSLPAPTEEELMQALSGAGEGQAAPEAAGGSSAIPRV